MPQDGNGEAQCRAASDPDGKQPAGTIGGDSTAALVRKARKDKKVKAIVLRVDSPGGSALASDLIWREVVRAKKPVVASMGDIAASGGGRLPADLATARN